MPSDSKQTYNIGPRSVCHVIVTASYSVGCVPGNFPYVPKLNVAAIFEFTGIIYLLNLDILVGIKHLLNIKCNRFNGIYIYILCHLNFLNDMILCILLGVT